MEERERFSPGAALAGLLAVAIGVLFAFEAADAIEVDHAILWPMSIVALGVALVAEALMHQANRD